jgi:hypothetical protein
MLQETLQLELHNLCLLFTKHFVYEIKGDETGRTHRQDESFLLGLVKKPKGKTTLER